MTSLEGRWCGNPSTRNDVPAGLLAWSARERPLIAVSAHGLWLIYGPRLRAAALGPCSRRVTGSGFTGSRHTRAAVSSDLRRTQHPPLGLDMAQRFAVVSIWPTAWEITEIPH